MKKIILLFFAVLICCACSDKENKRQAILKEQARRDSLALKVALMPTTDCLPFFYAQKCGIYQQLGLEVRLQKFNAQMDVDTALINGYADVAYSDLIRVALLQSRGYGLYAILPMETDITLMSNKSKRMRSLSHLEERMTAIARHSVTDMLLDTIIAQNKLDASTIYHPQINDIALRCDMLRNGTIDAAFLPEPYATQAAIEGHRPLYASSKQGIQIMTMAATSKAINDSSKQEQIKMLLKGYSLAIEALNGEPQKDSVRHILATYPVNRQTADSLKLPLYRIPAQIEPAQIQVAIRFLRGRRLINDTYKGDSLVNDIFIK